MPDAPPPDSADHAEDFSRRYAREMGYLTGDRMMELGIPAGENGSREPGKGHAVFMTEGNRRALADDSLLELDRQVNRQVPGLDRERRVAHQSKVDAGKPQSHPPVDNVPGEG